jgi:hypothetical protein
MAFYDAFVAAINDRRIDRAPVSIGKGAVVDEIDLAPTEISLAKQGPDIRRAGLLARAVGPVLDDAAAFAKANPSEVPRNRLRTREIQPHRPILLARLRRTALALAGFEICAAAGLH